MMRKFREFNEILVRNVRDSYDVPSRAVPDETRIKSCSRYNTSAYPMLCKPVKMGVTVYSLVFENGFLFNWLFHLGKDHAHATHGQPSTRRAWCARGGPRRARGRRRRAGRSRPTRPRRRPSP